MNPKPNSKREMPKIRAFAFQRWQAAVAAPKVSTTTGLPVVR